MNYKFSYTKAHQHFIDIEFTIDNITTSEIEIQLPAWRPGRYELANFAKNVQKWTAFDGEGNELAYHKTTKDCWIVQTNGVKTVVVCYNYYANELNAGSTYLDATMLYVNPVNCCLYVKERQEEPCTVTLNIPENYEIASGMISEGKELKAANFHELVDSPFIASPNLKHTDFELDNVKFNIWIQGECNPYWERIKTDFIAYTTQQLSVFGDFPVSEYHYLFLILPYKAYHGVEHQTSTVCSLGPGYDLMKKEVYDEFLGVSSHELFHTWNVKNIRPIEMQPYDYAKENYSPLGYVAEGVTTYYGDLMLYRSKVFTNAEFLKLLSGQLQKHYNNFARYTYSVAESSYDTWLDGYVAGVPNRKLSIYSDGCLLAFMVDVLVMKYTNNEKRLDDVMRLMYQEFGKKGKGYTAQDYQKAIEKISGEDFTFFFDKYVNGHHSYDDLLRKCIQFSGLKLEESPSDKYHEAYYGIKVDAKSRVVAVYPNSIADEVGIAVGDELLTLDNRPLDNNLAAWSKHFSGQEVAILVKKRLENVVVDFTPSEEVYYKNYVLKGDASALICN